MLMLTQILAHTPRWVFVLFALLVWLGLQQLAARTVSLARVTLLPIAMVGLSFFGMLSAFGDSPVALLGWAGAVSVLLAKHPEVARHTGFALGIGTVYGAFSGIFSARALRLWKLAIREDRVGLPAARA